MPVHRLKTDIKIIYRFSRQINSDRMLIVGYEETMHNAYYTADTNTFKESEYADMAEALNLTLAMPHLIDEALAMQKKAAVAADATDYMEILHL